MSDNIPFDIQIEIIKRVVDVKSLIRFKSVSKQWESFINSSEFIAGYRTRHTRLLLLRYTKAGQVKHVSFAHDDVINFPQQQLNLAPNVPLHINSDVIGSSRGLWCLRGVEKVSMFVIWNPSIRKLARISVPDEFSWHPFGYSTNIRFGFGVCSSTYDPTIVGIAWRWKECKHEVGIYTLSSDTWKMIPSSINMPSETIKLINSTPVAIDRFIFWVAYDTVVSDDRLELELENLILSFDLITHEFIEVELPYSIAYQVKVPAHISLSELNGSLVVSAYTYDVNDGRVYGVWMMGEEGGVMASFTKLFNINTPDDLSIRKVLGFTMSGEPIMETKKGRGMFATVQVYKPCSEDIIDLGIEGNIGSFFICPYAETLHLIDSSDGCLHF